VSLIDTESGMQQWSERYEREIDDIFALQDAITQTIAARLEPEIGFAERNRVALAPPTNLAAWDCYHLGVFHFYRFTGEDNLKAQQLLRRSFELDSDFGDAYAWWAYAVILGMVYWDTEPSTELLGQALDACDKALVIDRQNATFYALKARVLLACREYKQALKNNSIAIEMNPAFAAAYCGLGDSLAYEQRYDESIEYFEKSIALSPNDPQLWAFYTYGALALIFKGEYVQALNWLETAMSIPNHQYWTIAHKVVALAYLEQTVEMSAAAKQLRDIQPKFSIEFVRSKLFYLKEPKQIELYLEGLRKAGFS
jgi:tetratricopeptide (TPR) repeat protein